MKHLSNIVPTTFCGLADATGKYDIEVTPDAVKRIAEFIGDRTGSVMFRNVYHDYKVTDVSANDVMKQVTEWSKLPEPPRVRVTREPADYITTDGKQWFIVELTATRDVMTPEQWDAYTAGRKTTDDAISRYYDSKGSGGYTGD